MLDKIKNSPYIEKYETMEIIASTIGQYVVPFCVEVLGDKMSDDLRVDTIILLTRLGRDAV